MNARTLTQINGRLVLKGATMFRISRGKTGRAHVSKATVFILQSIVALFTGGIVELRDN